VCRQRNLKKSVNIWWSYGENSAAYFFGPSSVHLLPQYYDVTATCSITSEYKQTGSNSVHLQCLKSWLTAVRLKPVSLFLVIARRLQTGDLSLCPIFNVRRDHGLYVLCDDTSLFSLMARIWCCKSISRPVSFMFWLKVYRSVITGCAVGSGSAVVTMTCKVNTHYSV